MSLDYNEAQGIIKEQELAALEEFKNVSADELLSIWEQTQRMEFQMRENFGQQVVLAPNYEKIILDELQTRLINETLLVELPKRTRRISKKPRRMKFSPNPIISRG